MEKILSEVMTFKEATDFLGKYSNYLNILATKGKIIEDIHYRQAGGCRLILKSAVENIGKNDTENLIEPKCQLLKEVLTFKEGNIYLEKAGSFLNNMAFSGKLIEGVHYRQAGGCKLILKSVVDLLDLKNYDLNKGLEPLQEYEVTYLDTNNILHVESCYSRGFSDAERYYALKKGNLTGNKITNIKLLS